MKNGLSKTRSKRARTRAKKAEKAGLRNGETGNTGPDIPGVLVDALTWLTSLLLFRAGHGFQSTPLALVTLAQAALMLLLGLGLCAALVRITVPGMRRGHARALHLYVLSLFSIIPAGGIYYVLNQVPAVPAWVPVVSPYLLPVSLAPLLATILYGVPSGLVLGLWVSYVTAILAGNSFGVLIMGLVLSVAAVYLGKRVRKRFTIFKIGLILALLGGILAAIGLLRSAPSFDAATILIQLGACLASGLSVSVIVLLFLPLLEALFNVTTDITLLELSDLGHPVLQRLAIEAPGTYHHSLVVANLAQAAADEIGANALLARVCSYFHDIGKLTKPGFFAENIQRTANPHDTLAPSMSTLVITTHVKEGLSLAMVSKLPPPVLNVIQEHHGTGLVRYFHHKARQQMELELGEKGPESTMELREDDFRYPGPKPSTRESAIISLADSIEAASRSLEKPNPGHIETLVDDIVNEKLLDGQLDSCQLTMKDIRRIKRSFVFTLASMLHSRIAYPKDEDPDKQQPNGGSNQSEATAEVR